MWSGGLLLVGHLVLHIDQVNGKQKLEWNSVECNIIHNPVVNL